MVHFSKWKIVLIIGVCVAGILFAFPNFLSRQFRDSLPGWLPHRAMTLGLDLQGGSYLLLDVDLDELTRLRLENSEDAVRARLREAKLAAASITPSNRSLVVAFRDEATAEAGMAALRELDAVRVGELAAARSDTRVTLTPSDAAVRERGNQAIAQSIEIVRRRIDETGVNEPIIARQGESRILIQLPGVEDPERVKRLLGTTAKMTFHLVNTTADPSTGRAPPGTRILPSEERSREGTPARYVVNSRVEVEGANLTDAQATLDQQSGQWVVNFTFDGVGTRAFARVTQANVGRPFAIVLDNKVISAPVIREPITGGRGQISGNFTVQSANDLAVLLRAGALPAPIKIIEERSVGPDLGADSIRAGVLSCVIGLTLVCTYMIVFYGLFGIFANIAVFFNLVLTVAVLSIMQATLTLPGIAGLLLTVGLSVDANILINERIREESRRGRSPIAALDAGFQRAFATIVDSNVTTLIKMLLLFSFGSGVVRGFAVSISLGIMTSMFTAVTLVRLMLVTWLKRVRPKTLMPGRIRLVPDDTKIPFMKGRYAGLITSAVLSLLSVFLFFYPGLNYGIDFKGGIVMEVRTQEAADFGALRSSLHSLNVGPVALQQFGSPNDVLIRLERQAGDEGAQQRAVENIRATLDQNFPGTSIRRVESVGATVSGELFRDGMIALGLSMVAMLVYIWFRFEWHFGVGAVATLLLDITKIIGLYVVLNLQFNLTAIAAILTIMGYSINDKVVVYDRVRENLRKYKSMPLRQLIDLSINETLNRTIGTSMTSFLSVLPLAVLGGEALSEFAIAVLIGIVIATSSSIFIAAPILLFLGEHRLRRRQAAAATPPEAGLTPTT